jgi:hypothetical protein
MDFFKENGQAVREGGLFEIFFHLSPLSKFQKAWFDSNYTNIPSLRAFRAEGTPEVEGCEAISYSARR